MKHTKTLALCLSFFTFSTQASRSIHRPQSNPTPTITAYWENDKTEQHTLKSICLNPHNIFELYEKEYLMNHWFHTEQDEQKKALTSDLITALTEIQKSKNPIKTVTHFDVFKSCDFDHKRHAGNIVLKHKKYPYVAKIFIETPTAFVHPFSKGIEPYCFFFMGYGTSRYLCGLTRIKNREAIMNIIQNDESLKKIFFIPQKWYWEPPNNKRFCVEGSYFAHNKTYQITYPHIYVIICELVNIDRPFSYFSRVDRSYINLLIQKLKNNRIDPNAPNFVYEKNSSRIALIDTEHFATMMGLEKTIPFKQYRQWYTQLALNFIYNCTFQSSKHLSQKQLTPSENLCI